METFWCITTSPGPAPIMVPMRLPTVTGISHQPSSQAQTPREAHVSANSCNALAARRGIAPSEWLMRYVVFPRIGNSARHASKESVVTVTGEPRARLATQQYLMLPPLSVRDSRCDRSHKRHGLPQKSASDFNP